eukprot:jgi/Tetstr1/449080/TSEL_036293.t1
MCHRLDRQDVHHTMSLLDEVNRTLDKNSTESLVDFLDRKWEAIRAYDAAMEDDSTAAVTDQPGDDTDAGDELTLEEEEMLLNYASYPPDPSGESNMQQTIALLSAAGIPTPRNFKEAMSPEFRDLWKPTIHKEYEGLMANRTWELVDCPPGATILPNQWVFVAKAAPDGTLDKSKARAVVCGNYQKDGDTCKETYAPVIRISSLRIFFTIVAAMQLHLRQLDAVAAYLNASIPADEYLYMRQLQGFDDDADFAADLIQRRSRGGYLFRLGDHGACSYKSALMPTATQETGGGIAQSAVDAETVSLAQAIKDGFHLKILVSEILGSPVQPLIMMEDNQGAISYATNAVISDRTKHIDVKWHFVKDHVEAGTARVNYIATDLNTADKMTKPLPRPALEKHARFAMGW